MSEDRELLDGHVYVDVSGLTGTGKSAVMGEIEIALRALGVTVEHDADFQSEKNMTHADWQTALDLYKPTVVIRETNVSRARPPAIGVEAAPWATCQDCGGVIEGWICQSCDREFEENDAGYLVFAAPSTIQTGVEDVAWRERDREAVARLVDPRAWNRFDREKTFADHVQRNQRIDWTAYLARSLAKADAILAALPSVPVGGLGASAAPIPTEGHDAGAVDFRPLALQMMAALDAMAVVIDGLPEDVCEVHADNLNALSDVLDAISLESLRAILAGQQAAISDDTQPGTDDAPCVGSAPSLPTEDAAGGWQDISTAPKDGTDVLIWNCEGAEIAHWAPKEDDGPDQPGCDEGWHGTYAWPGRSWGTRLQSFPQGQPTHWMPLPASPTTPASLDGDAT